ncbi:fungal-specific transcription factor domain-containing protein [Trichoderma aethiopicum]
MGIKGCWTCRERKIRCDLRKPTCVNCSKSLHACKGYGMQLSWPREGDKRRAIVNDSTATVTKLPKQYRRRGTTFLNASSWDVALSEALQDNRNLGQRLSPLSVSHLPFLPSSPSLGDNAILLDYFNATKTQILSPIIDEALAHYVMRTAMVTSGPTVNLVMQGIFTLSALLLLGPSKCQEHKSRLISMLQTNLAKSDRDSVLQNLIATMLLYQCEVCDTASNGVLWRLYLCGAKKIISAASHSRILYRHDCAILMDWIYYHEVMSEFSLRHWAERSTINSFCKGPQAIRPSNITIDDSLASNGITCPMDALDLVRNVCKRPSPDRNDDMPYNNAEMEQIQQLRQSIYEVIGEYGTFHDNCGSLLNRQDMMTALYRYAALVYLNRSVANVSTSSFSHRRLVREGILLLQNLGFCESAWPLFIIACEANEDEQRLQILTTLADTRRELGKRSSQMPLIQQMIEAVWHQNDLNVESDVSYCRIVDAVISTAPSLPLFA